MEQRREKRHTVRTLIGRIYSPEYSDATMESINISPGGLFFRSNRDIRLGAEVSLVFRLPRRETPVEARCRVVHKLEALPGLQYLVGTEFISLKGISETELADLLEQADKPEGQGNGCRPG